MISIGYDIVSVMYILLIVLVVMLIFVLKQEGKTFTESFMMKPPRKKLAKFMQDVKKNKELFSKSYPDARYNLPWLDPVLYYDLSNLYYSGKMSDKNIKYVLSK